MKSILLISAIITFALGALLSRCAPTGHTVPRILPSALSAELEEAVSMGGDQDDLIAIMQRHGLTASQIRNYFGQ